jgi:hypothetical protein
MPCYSCGARQSDPERGPSPWKRAVVREHLVLVCPACQRRPGWSAELQSCARCESLHLIRRLDQVECLDCRLVRQAAPEDAAAEHSAPEGTATEGTATEGTASQDAAPADGPAGDAALAAEVASALSRVLYRR